MPRRFGLVPLLLLVIAPPVARSQQDSAAPPHSAQELAERYRQAHARKDVEAIERLFYWGSADERTRKAVASFIAHDVANPIRGVSVAPLEAGDRTEYTTGGIVYRMTLPPTAKLVIDFLPHKEGRLTHNSEQTSYFIGARDGQYWLVTAEPADSARPKKSSRPASRPPRAPQPTHRVR